MKKELGYGQKAARIMELLNSSDWTDHQIAYAAGCHVTYVRALRRNMAHIDSLMEPGEDETESANDIQMGGDHYKRLGVEPWEVFDTWPIEQRIGAYRANCTKYVMRLDAKDTPLLNAQKLAHYAQKLVEVLEER
jgi:hypothetical protein